MRVVEFTMVILQQKNCINVGIKAFWYRNTVGENNIGASKYKISFGTL